MDAETKQKIFPDMQPVHATNQRVLYKDLYLRIIACAVGTHMIIVYGETRSVFEMLLMPAYYYAFIGSFAIALILFTAVRKIFIELDKRFDWMLQPVVRLVLQALFGFLIPGIMAFLLAACYFALRGHNILRTTYLRYDFQFILLQLLLINFYYIAFYFYSRWNQAKEIIDALGKHLDSKGGDKSQMENETFQVSKGARNLLIRLEDIAYFHRDGDTNFLRSMDGEDFFITQSLDELQQQLPDRFFFRVNRQMIAHRQTFRGYDLLTYGKLRAELYPKYKEDVIVSQKRALTFKSWITIEVAKT